MSLVHDLIDAVQFVHRQQGWRAALGHVLLPFAEYHHGYILRRRLTEPIEIPFLADAVVFRQARPEDAGLLATIAPRLRVRRFIDKMRAGEVCLIGIDGSRVVGMAWAAFAGSETAKDMPFTLSPVEAYMWGALVPPGHRSRGVMTALSTDLLVWLKNRGFESAYQLTNLSNSAALRQLSKIGSRAIGEIRLLRILKRRFKRYQPLAAPVEASRQVAPV